MAQLRETVLPVEEQFLRRAAVALGSNLGSRASHLAFGVERLRQVLSEVVVSRFIETEPEHAVGDPIFLNGAVVGETNDTPQRLLEALLAIELERGRVRSYQGAPRTLDLDLVLLGDLIVESQTLRLPHPRFRSRAFVLGPLAEIGPNLVDPVTGKTVVQLNALLR